MPDKFPFVLDTHIWIWFMEATGNLSDIIIAKINQAAKRKQIIIAAISFWEVCMLAKKKHIEFGKDIVSWLNDALLYPGIITCPLTPIIAADSYNLPADFHGDPADRLIVATARIENATLVTADEKILRYAKAGHVRCLQA